jgi:Na+/melibiose symporter-like transporter
VSSRSPAPTRDLRLLAAAVCCSAAGDGLALVVLALQVHALTASGLAVSALFATVLVPAVALVRPAGRITDRGDPRRVLAAASLVQALSAVALAFAGDVGTLLALSAVLAAGNAVAQPAEFALLPAVAGPGRLTAATGTVEAARSAGLAAGPLLGAGLAALGPQPALLADAATFLVIAVAARALRPAPARRAVRAGGQRPGTPGGGGLLRRDPVLRVVLPAATGALAILAATPTVEVFYVKDVLGAGDAAYALVVSAWMAGMVAGAAGFARRVPVAWLAPAALAALGLQAAGIGIQATWAVLPVAVAGYLTGGAGQGVKDVLLRALIAARVPAAAHGRAFAAYAAARNAAQLVALAAGGALVAALGARTALVVAGAGPLLVAGAGLLALRRAGAPARAEQQQRPGGDERQRGGAGHDDGERVQGGGRLALLLARRHRARRARDRPAHGRGPADAGQQADHEQLEKRVAEADGGDHAAPPPGRMVAPWPRPSRSPWWTRTRASSASSSTGSTRRG